jgi:hypothetical protein
MAELTPLQRARKDLEELMEWAKENGVDDRSLILLAKDVHERCADGIISEKVNVKVDEGKVEVLERFPAVELSALHFIHKVKQDALRQLEKEAPPDPVINLIMSRVRLEDMLKDRDD